jgi:hypothetical protein
LSSVLNSAEEPPLTNGLINSPASSAVESSALPNRPQGNVAGVSSEFSSRTNTVTSRSYPASSVASGSASSTTGHVAQPVRQHGQNVRHFKSQQARVTTTASVSMNRTLMTQSVRPPTGGGSPGSNDRYPKTNSRYGENGVNYMNGR